MLVHLENYLIHHEANLLFKTIQKTGSTYYENLLQYNGFEYFREGSVEVSNYHMVAFIMDPKRRYYKALAEDFQTMYEEYPKEVIRVLTHKDSLIISDHCEAVTVNDIPLELTPDIDWIPFDKNSIKYLNKIFEYYKLSLNTDFDVDINESSTLQKELYNKIKDADTWRGWILRYYHNDNILYDNISRTFTKIDDVSEEHWNDLTWKDISWWKSTFDSKSNQVPANRLNQKLGL